MFLKDEQNRA